MFVIYRVNRVNEKSGSFIKLPLDHSEADLRKAIFKSSDLDLSIHDEFECFKVNVFHYIDYLENKEFRLIKDNRNLKTKLKKILGIAMYPNSVEPEIEELYGKVV